MIELKGYEIVEVISKGDTFTLFKGIKLADNTFVRLRTSSAAPKLWHFIALKQNHSLSQKLESINILKSIACLSENDRVIEIIEDGPEIDSRDYFNKSRKDNSGFEKEAKILSDICKILLDVHQKQIIHLGICPSAILIDPKTESIKLSNFTHSIFLTEGRNSSSNYMTDEMFHFISPEQTGKLSKSLDQRSDIYSLGLTAYELFTGHKPFENVEKSELIHCHLARNPIPAAELCSDLPAILGAIIAKMINKEPDQRYQSLYGIIRDIEKFLATPKLNFPLGVHDITDQLSTSNELIGRDDELKRIAGILDHYSEKTHQSVFITGINGMGKSRFLRSAKDLALQKRYHIISVQCSRKKSLVPLSTIIDIIQDILDQLFKLPQAELDKWGIKIKNAIGNQGAALSSLVPDITRVIGESDELPKATLREEQDRFIKVLVELLNVYSSGFAPMLVFIEDLELCDKESELFIQSLPQLASQPPFLLIATTTIDNLPKSRWMAEDPVDNLANLKTQIRLKSFDEQVLVKLISKSIGLTEKEIADLAAIVRAKTGGVPQFVFEFLQTIRTDNLLSFDHKSNRWKWDIKEIKELNASKDVSKLLMKRVDDLSNDCKEVLRIAACLGQRFDIQLLADIKGKDKLETIDQIDEAVSGGIIKTINSVSVDHAIKISDPDLEFEFTVAEIQQNIYATVSEDSKSRIHLQSGRSLIKSYTNEDAKLFEIANHINLGFSLITVAGDNKDLFDILRQAGLKAKASLSYGLSFQYLNHARHLITTSDWMSDHDSMYQLMLELLEAAHLTDKADYAAKLFKEILEVSRSNEDKARLHMIQARIEVHLSKLEESFLSARQGLQYLGITLPKYPGKLRVGIEIIKSKLSLRGKNFQSILQLPKMKDERTSIAFSIYYYLLPYAFASPELYSLIALRMMRLTLAKGIHDFSYSGFTVYGSILSVGFGQFDKGYAFMDFATEVAKTSNNLSAEAGALFGLGMQGVNKRPLKACIDYFERAHSLADLAGAKFYASTATNHIAIYKFFFGTPLETLEDEVSIYRDYADKSNEKATYLFQSSLLSLIKAFRSSTTEEAQMNLDSFSEVDSMIPILRTWHYITRQVFYYLLGDHDKSLEAADRAEESIESTSFHLMFHYYNLFKVLALAGVPKTHDSKKQNAAKQLIKKNLSKLKKYALHSPNVFQHLYKIQLGIKENLSGNESRGLDYLNEAFEPSDNSDEYSFLRAVKDEIVLQFNKKALDPNEIIQITNNLLGTYKKWGAKGKADILINKYPELQKHGIINDASNRELSINWELTNQTGEARSEIKTIIETLQSISKEIELDKLRETLIRSAMRFAGAEMGCIASVNETNSIIEINATYSGPTLVLKRNIPLTTTNIATQIINYVNRSRKIVVLENAKSDEQFGHDPYITNESVKSVLCIPLEQQGKMLGVMYFENNLTSGVFTSDKLEILKLLSSQASISLQNASLYNNLFELNKAYQRFVPLEFINLLNKSSVTDINLGLGINREMTVLFSDIRGFTSMSEKLTPEKAFEFLNEYLKIMEPIIKSCNGFIDKFIGDGIMALFPADVDDALHCSLKMIEGVNTFNTGRKKPIQIGIGINAGPLMLGTVGSENRMDGTVISDVVNVASRIEQLTKTLDESVLISEDVIKQLKNPAAFNLVKLDTVVAKGRKGQTTLYGLRTK